ncbi:MAG TPA: DEAD/DEAH box helicase, partial [Candidatus Corynebacterium intestinavium]|nr:DEAD/DEAH box helicase [Candidatus Corynebacterium intestinavium]
MAEQSTTPTSGAGSASNSPGAGSAPNSLGAGSAPNSLGAELIEDLRAAMPDSTVTHVRHVPARLSTPADWPDWSLPSLRETLRRGGVQKPWSHQAETAQHAWEGRDVIVATGTASGKSLGYQLPILTTLAKDPTATALYLAPTKALAQDQMQALARLCAATPELADVMVATYDGDTPPEARRAIREQARIIVTNPDMLHASILGNPKRWTRLLKTLRYLVVDECHVYRGVFGAHVAMVLRRLLRLVPGAGFSGSGQAGPSSVAGPPSVTGAESRTSGPTVIMASATSVDPAAHARRLTGRAEVVAVTEDGSPAGERTIALWEPGFLEGVEGEHGAPVRRSANSEAAEVMARVIA